MQRHSGTYRWIIVIGIWLITCGIPLTITASNQATQPSAWGRTPTMSSDVLPHYEFHSTSTFQPVVGATSYTSELSAPGAYSPQNSPQRRGPWDRPTDPAVGEIDTPVGEPHILFLLALLYMAWRIVQPKRSARRQKTSD